MKILNHRRKSLSLHKLLTQPEPLYGLNRHLLVYLYPRKTLYHKVYLPRSLHPHLAHVVVTQFQTNGKYVLKHRLCLVYRCQVTQLVSNTVPHSPFLRVFLQHQKHVNQILSRHRIKQSHKIRQMINCIQFQRIRLIFQYRIKCSKHMFLS